MKKYSILTFLMTIWLSTALFAQSDNDKALARMNRDAQNTMRYKEYSTAINIYDQLLKAKPEDLEYNYQMGVCYLNSQKRKESLKYFQKVYDANPNYNPTLEMMMGQAKHYQGNFAEAKDHYAKAKTNLEKYKGELAGAKMKKKERAKKIAETEDLIKSCDKKIQECENGLKMQAEPVNAHVENLGSGVNTQYPEYTPLIPKDTSFMVFTSRREGSVGNKKDWQDDMYFEDIYQAKPSNNTWGASQSLNVNKKFHDAAAEISSDGKTLFLYRDDPKTKGDLYVTNFDAATNQWAEPKKLNSNINTKHQETALALSTDGNTMYFTSDRPGGTGGLDIYMSKKESNGDWGPATNLGSPINTAYDDDAPFLSFDGKTLYFSSKGHNNMGGYDIFKSEQNGDKWSEPKNMGTPINGADDDVHLVLTEDNKTGYYVSADESGYGDKDIYTLTAPRLSLLKLDKTGLKITPPGLLALDSLKERRKIDFEFLVLYDFDRSNLRPASKESCDRLIKYLERNPDIRIEVSGHTCNIGTKEYNQVLSVARARAVANYLIERGVDANRVDVKGYNFEKPKEPNTSNENRIKNRRAEFEVKE
jgi:outer membrane protein OmpA-like peptidoglycan-associated protein/tetratricopeptide (TPR) repeat protein